MKKVTLDTAKNIIGGACTYKYDMVNDVCVQTSSCTTFPTKFGQTVTLTSQKDVASSFCNAEPQV